MKILTNYDFAGNEIQNVKVQNLSTAPANPRKGMIYFNTVDNILYYYNGLVWVEADGNNVMIEASRLVQDSSHRLVTDAEKVIWNDAASAAGSIPQATETTLGGIKAKIKTTEVSEVAIDPETGKLYAPESGVVGIPNGGATGYFLKKKSGTDGDAQWVEPPILLKSPGGIYTEDFEDETYIFDTTLSGMTRITNGANGSQRCMQSSNNANRTDAVTVKKHVLFSGKVGFYYKCSHMLPGRPDFSKFLVYDNGVVKLTQANNVASWTRFEFDVSPGFHEIKFTKFTDYGATCQFWLDDISLPGDGVEGMTAIFSNPDSLLVSNTPGTAVGFIPKSTFLTETPQATETELGGIKAKTRTTENTEVVIDSSTGKLYVPAAGETENGLPAGGAAGQVLSKVDGTDYNAEWADNPSAFSVAVAGGYSGNEENFETDLASIEDLAAAIDAIVGDGGAYEWVKQKRSFHFFLGGAVAQETSAISTFATMPLRLLKVFLGVDAAPTGQPIVCDVNLNGASIFPDTNQQPVILAGETQASCQLPTPVNVQEFDKISVDIDQVGNQETGSNLSVVILCEVV